MPFARFDRMTPQRLEELIDRFRNTRIAVLGDFFLDKYLDVDPALAEVSIETGKIAHQVVGVRHSPGAAGTVVCNLSALGAGTIHAIGFTGEDGESYDLRQDLAALRCGTDHLHCEPGRMTPTYLKPRDKTDPSLAGEHERYDNKNRRPATVATQQKILSSLDALLPHLDAVIVLDQVEEENCGVVTTTVRETLADRARRCPNVVFWGDSRRRVRQFRYLTIKPNQFEVVGRLNPPPSETVQLDELARAVEDLRARAAAPVFVTRGHDGMVVSDPELTVVPGVKLDGPTDPTGAGDSATAGAVLGLAAGAQLAEAALLGNLVASITVEHLATTGTARPDELLPRLELWQRQREATP
jgi:bifunctional ADP-heptose synthase (sugar kinase/adenylyltransferase)